MKINWNNTQVRMGMVGRSNHKRDPARDRWSGEYTDQCLWLVFAGEGELLTRNGRVSLRPGVCLWLRPGWIYKVKYSNPENLMDNYFIHFDLLDRQGKKLSISSLPPEELHPPDIELAEANVRWIVQTILKIQHEDAMAESPRNGPEIEAVTMLLTGFLMQLDAHSDGDFGPTDATATYHRTAMFEAATRLAESTQKQPRIAELAKELGYGTDHFTRVFRHIIGSTPKAYALSARIHRAAMLLRNPDLSVNEIATQVGYESVYAFSSQFKRSTSLSPTEYRKKEHT
ncbi:MAG: AraC family transcriptional regulator [Verrucomicrobiota bacterium]